MNTSILAQKVDLPTIWHDQLISVSVKGKIEAVVSHIERSNISLQEKVHLKKTKSSTKILFEGPSKQDKINAAIYLSKSLGKDLCRINLSDVVSKYIGETEKNLERILSEAANMDIVLLFDEADALFGKRTNVKDAHDRYDNQEISCLLQSIEEYKGILILATNRKEDIDAAFLRRFYTIINFSGNN